MTVVTEMNASLFLTLKRTHLSLESRGFLQGTPPKYRVALFHFIETFETIQKALKDMNQLVRHGGEIRTQIPKYLRLMHLCPHCPRETALKQISLN